MPAPSGARFKEALARSLKKARPRRLRLRGFISCAVLVPVVALKEGPALLLTVRNRGLSSHGGQIAFPGGRKERGDISLRAAALRETREELGIPENRIEILGPLDDVPTPLGFVISPWVGWFEQAPDLVPQAREVEAFFFVPCSRLRRPSCYSQGGWREIAGRRYPLPEFRAGRRRIWGATARIIQDLLRRAG
ncbi:MAG: CoA pyrophosphatase [Elusimicrobia bacterium]|nr:CoA pyrophosphatase [Elusimicrobiota bacterium]